MGMFDSVFYTCECGAFVEWQSKVGHCCLAQYGKNQVPVEIAKDINNDIVRCEKCDRKYIITIRNNISTVPMDIEEVNDE